MPWKTSLGVDLAFPWTLSQQAMKMKVADKDREVINGILHETVRYHSECQRMDYMLITYQQRIQQLEAENRFMLKLIEKHCIGE
jgi:hypothetical protein